MKLENPLKANDWDIISFFKLIASLQLAVLLILGLDAVGVHVPILREVLVLIYLLFVPGIVLLRILRFHERNVIETMFYTVGLSVAMIMLIGLFINTVYSYGLTQTPLTLLPFIATITGVVAALCALCCVRDREFRRSTTFDPRAAVSPLGLSLLLLPLISVYGTWLFNVSGTSIGTAIALLAVAILILACGFTRWVPKSYYPLAIGAIALALLLRNALVTNYLWGFDIQIEHYVAQTVVSNGYWGAPASFDRNVMNLNSMLSITMLAPLLSIATGISVAWVLKLIFPLLFAIVPIGLYRLYEKQTSARIALFGVFFFVVTFSFYTEMLAMARQEIAELFFVALLLLLVDNEMRRVQRYSLFGLFGLSLIISHYALTFVFMFCFILAWLALVIAERVDLRALTQKLTRKKEGMDQVTPQFLHLNRLREINSGMSATFVLGLTLIAAGWYRFANNSQPFDQFVRILMMTLRYVGFQNPFAQAGLSANNTSDLPAPAVISRASGLDTTGLQSIISYKLPLHQVTEALILIALIIVIIGILYTLKERSQFKFSNEYLAFSGGMLVVLYLCLVQPYFAANLNLSRFVHISQIVLSVFLVTGFVGVVSIFERRRVNLVSEEVTKPIFKVLACFMVLLFLFNAGLVYKVAGELNDSPTLIALDTRVDNAKFSDQEMIAAKWVAANDSSGGIIAADSFRYYAVYTYSPTQARMLGNGGSWTDLKPGSYLYLGTPNVQTGKLVVGLNILTVLPTEIDARYYIGPNNKIYSNGDAEVYYANG